MIGNKPLIADVERVEEMRGSGELAEMLSKISWLSQGEDKENQKKPVWKPKHAKVEKGSTEVKKALKAVEKRRR